MKKVTILLSLILTIGLMSFTNPVVIETDDYAPNEMVSQINELILSVQEATMELFVPPPKPPALYKLKFHSANPECPWSEITVNCWNATDESNAVATYCPVTEGCDQRTYDRYFRVGSPPTYHYYADSNNPFTCVEE